MYYLFHLLFLILHTLYDVRVNSTTFVLLTAPVDLYMTVIGVKHISNDKSLL